MFFGVFFGGAALARVLKNKRNDGRGEECGNWIACNSGEDVLNYSNSEVSLAGVHAVALRLSKRPRRLQVWMLPFVADMNFAG